MVTISLLYIFKALVALTLVFISSLVYIFRFAPTEQQNRFGFWVGSWCLRLSMCFLPHTVFTIDYFGGFMLHFEVTIDDLKKHIPNKQLTPIPMKILATEQEEAKYLVSIYSAELDLKGSKDIAGRADVFTYAKDAYGEVGLVFLCALVDYPADPTMKWITEMLNHFFGMCPRKNETGYPHHESDLIQLKDDSLQMKHGDCTIHVAGDDAKKQKDLRMHLDFICANSQIYRGSDNTRNVNFFNKVIIGSAVTEVQ